VFSEEFYLRIEDDAVVGAVDGEDFAYEADDSDSTTKELEAFVAACRDGDPDAVRSDYADARRSLEVTLAVNESIETGERVDPADVD
jgi:predicted dehydrogenase